MKKVLSTFFVIVITVFFFCSKNTNNPGVKILKDKFSQELPEAYELKSFSLENQENIGTDIEPIYKSEFRATIVLKMNDLVRKKNFIGGRLPEKLRSKTVEGIAVSRFIEDSWNIEFKKKGGDSSDIFIMKSDDNENMSHINIIEKNCDSKQCEIIDRFEKLYNEHNIEKLFDLCNDSLIVNGSLDKDGFSDMIASDFAVNSEMMVTNKHQKKDTVFCDFELKTDIHNLLGISSIHYDNSYFVFREYSIIEINIKQRREDVQKLNQRFMAFRKWVEKHHEDKLLKLQQNGEYIINPTTKEDWLSLLKLWKKVVADR